MTDRQIGSLLYPYPFRLVSSADHLSPVTGLGSAVTVTLSINGGAFAAALGAVSEIGAGWYSLAGNATDRATIGSGAINAVGAGSDPFDGRLDIVAHDPFGQAFPANFAAMAINTSGHVIEQHTLVYTATAASGTASTIVFPTGASTTTHAYEGCRVRLVAGTGGTPYQERVIKAYNGVSLTATVDRAWTTAPDATTVFEVVLDDNAGLDVNQNVNANVVDAAGSPSVPMTVATIATACAGAILKTPANLLATDATGYVTLTALGLDQIIAEPAAGTQPAINARQAIAVTFDAAAGGLIVNTGTLQWSVQNPAGTLNRVVETLDNNSNRTGVVLALP
ncbi:MAG: hypothetical protein KGM43_06365 [Planctomycetota bacterium]|nr:hypothetical protein [Planctomycetota bacterium]